MQSENEQVYYSLFLHTEFEFDVFIKKLKIGHISNFVYLDDLLKFANDYKGYLCEGQYFAIGTVNNYDEKIPFKTIVL